MEQEEIVWSDSPSQVDNYGVFIFCILFCWLIFPLFIMLWVWLDVKNTKYELTSQRLRIIGGVLNKSTDDLELYRVKDYTVEQPFFLRFFSLGNVVLKTTDKSHPVVVIRAISEPEKLMESIRNHVENLRNKKRRIY